MTEVGDAWRRFALHCAKQVRSQQAVELAAIGDSLQQVATLETQVFRQLLTLARDLRS